MRIYCSPSRREREGIETTMNRMQINIEYLQDENRAKVSEISALTNEIEEITTQSEEKSMEIKNRKVGPHLHILRKVKSLRSGVRSLSIPK